MYAAFGLKVIVQSSLFEYGPYVTERRPVVAVTVIDVHSALTSAAPHKSTSNMTASMFKRVSRPEST